MMLLLPRALRSGAVRGAAQRVSSTQAAPPPPPAAPSPSPAPPQSPAASAAAPMSTAVLPPQGAGEWARACLDLSKYRLGSLVAFTTGAGYYMGAGAGAAGIVPVAGCMGGTVLCIAAANALNQVYEMFTDAQMRRTVARVLPSGRLSGAQALAFAAGTGLAGTGLLAATTNLTTAALGLGNVFLYAGVYTPLKRYHEVNTWVGAVVGAIPPVMGWVAATGTLADPGWTPLFAMLYLWQIPHFLSLSWLIRGDYALVGYRMLSITNPAKNADLTFRYALYLMGVGPAAYALGLTDPWFAVDSTLIAGALAVPAWRFRQAPSRTTALSTFRASLIYLPAVMALMALHRKQRGQGEHVSDATQHGKE